MPQHRPLVLGVAAFIGVGTVLDLVGRWIEASAGVRGVATNLELGDTDTGTDLRRCEALVTKHVQDEAGACTTLEHGCRHGVMKDLHRRRPTTAR